MVMHRCIVLYKASGYWMFLKMFFPFFLGSKEIVNTYKFDYTMYQDMRFQNYYI